MPAPLLKCPQPPPNVWHALARRRTLERGGPAFIKWGQWAATRRDLFPPDLCVELEKLHTQAPAHGMRFTEAAIHEVGMSWGAFWGVQLVLACLQCVLMRLQDLKLHGIVG